MTINSIGFVGTGAITEAMVRGLLAEPAYASEIHVSPRSAHIAATLAAEFASVRIAGDNQTVVDRSDMVFLAIRPQIAEEVVRALSFRTGQTIVSLVAATERQAVLDWIGADINLVQAIPLPFVAQRQGVTAIYPANATIAALFDTLGTAVQCQSRKEYDLLAAASAVMSTYFGVMESITGWLEKSGLERAKGQAYIAPLFASLAQKANNPCNEPFSALSREFATKGGLNEQVLSDFDNKGGLAALTAALDGVLARIEGRNS
ncbi:pyrroline-5-carboxylate reductase [Rhizobium sp. RMa-01]|uniref:pyrroline-5-carboxylate reductase n=1 Tax=unclassified Rhizobium TaxID=2613769 RepID=UPI0008D9B634|nr:MULTISPECIES: pyrroline-5-carboxylate reductase [unclassified Rhizobium]OHV18771.1 pyrroline-5-carboxylate reductase [Rhizobium sp. RSm-3]RVU10513.1 pyrroline-5-carboxylate reductase [Rhizobium sp. RMa-01]